jgi:branched-chain amino acid transport system permease protein
MVRDHWIHILVVAVFMLYPGIYQGLVFAEETTSILEFLLPQPRRLTEVMIIGLFAISFDFISGYTGYLSFGHSLFFGAGAYFTLGVANGAFQTGGIPLLGAIPQETHFVFLMILAAVLATVLAVVVGLVSFRLTGVYFAMITLGAAELARFTVQSYVGTESAFNPPSDRAFQIGVPFVDGLNLPVASFTGGQILLHEIPVVAQLLDVLAILPFVNAEGVVGADFYTIGLVVLVSYLIMQRFIHSPFGRVMIAIRENEERASAIGYNTFRYKLTAFAMSAWFAAMAGALKAAFLRQAKPGADFGVLERGGTALLNIIIGGIGTLAGPLYGAIFNLNLEEIFGRGEEGITTMLRQTFTGLEEAELLGTSLLDLVNVTFAQHPELYIGLIFIVFVLFVPGGLLGTLRLLAGGKIAKVFPEWLTDKLPNR